MNYIELAPGVVRIDECLASVGRLLAAGHLSSAGAREELTLMLGELIDAAEVARLGPLHRVAIRLRALVCDSLTGGPELSADAREALLNGFELMAMLAQDAERQGRGYPAAALEEAVRAHLARTARMLGREAAARLCGVHVTRDSAALDTTTLHAAFERAREEGRRSCVLHGKEAVVACSGAWIEVPRLLADAVCDPVAHLVRNSIAHGIEPPSVRGVLGKPDTGSVEVSACLDRRQLVVEVADDGMGIDAPETVSASLGGMRTIRDCVTALDGFVDVISERGDLTRVTLRLPLVAPKSSVRQRGIPGYH